MISIAECYAEQRNKESSIKYIELAISAVNQPLFSGEHPGEYNPKATIMVQTPMYVCMYVRMYMYVCLYSRSYIVYAYFNMFVSYANVCMYCVYIRLYDCGQLRVIMAFISLVDRIRRCDATRF